MMKNIAGFILLVSVIAIAYAGGNPEFVTFPGDYKDNFTLYHTQNRANNKQVADFYANSVATESIKQGEFADGSIIVMEIYKPEVNEAEEPVTGADGLFVKSKLAAIAVMEKRNQWDSSYSPDHRTGDWGYAIYDAQGGVKENDLNCVSCHMPLQNDEFLFTFKHIGK